MEKLWAFLAIGCVAFAATTPAASAAAQERAVVVRTLAGAEPPGFAATAEAIERAASSQLTVISAAQMAELLRQRHSSEPAAASQDDFDALARESEAALEHVAFGRRRQARRAIESILERAQGAIEALNRESRSARRVLNSCLYLVRALSDAGDEEGALNQAIECARLVPDMQPSASEHPPAVRRLYQRAVERIESGPHGSLHVESRPPGCDVYMNGRRLGTTPFTREQLPTGEYRIQVECESGRPGRVHRFILAAEPRELVIDSRFDRTLRSTAGDVRLEYEDAQAEYAHRMADGVAVAEILGATDLLLVSAEDPEVARVDWIRVGEPPRVLASAKIAMSASGASPSSVQRGMVALLQRRSVDATHDEDIEIAAWSPPAPRQATSAMGRDIEPPPSDDGAPEATNDLAWLGWVLGGVGVVSYGVGWGLQGEWFHRDGLVNVAQPTDPDYQLRLDRRDEMVAPVALLGVGGAVLTTAALPFLVGDGGPEWWHWVIGGVGVAAAAVGIGLWTQEGKCADPMCSERNRTVPLAPLVLTMSVPLLALPIVALIFDSGEDARPNDLSVLPSVGPNGAGLIIGGTL